MTQRGSTVRDTVEQTVAASLSPLSGQPDSNASGVCLPPLRFTAGLVTDPAALVRDVFGMGARLVVPPGTWAVVYLPGGTQQVYDPGSYWLWGAPGTVLVQWVDARSQQVAVGPIEGWSADKWRVRLWLTVDVIVAAPLLVATAREPLAVLAAATRTATLHYIEQHNHATLTGCVADEGGVDRPARAVLAALRDDPALGSLTIIHVRVVERQGDERQIEATTTATVAAAQIDEQRRVADARQRSRMHELAAQATLAEREHVLRMAATAADARERLLQQQAEVQQAALAARLDVVMAQIRAQVAEIAHDEQVWQAEQTRFQAEWQLVQQQQQAAHTTDQHVRLLEAQQGIAQHEAETTLAIQDRQHHHALALADLQRQLAAQRTERADAVAERRAHHEQALLDLHLRHEQLVAEQMARLEQWRSAQQQGQIQAQQQHDRQLASINGAAQIGAAAAATTTPDAAVRPAVADAGLRLLQELAE